MQLASFLDPELQPKKGRRSIKQKWQQMGGTGIGKAWTKKEILEAYFNFVTFYGELQGVAAASMALI